MTKKEIIKLIEERYLLSKNNYLHYKNMFAQSMNKMDIEQAKKQHAWMLEEYSVLTELRYILSFIRRMNKCKRQMHE